LFFFIENVVLGQAKIPLKLYYAHVFLLSKSAHSILDGVLMPVQGQIVRNLVLNESAIIEKIQLLGSRVSVTFTGTQTQRRSNKSYYSRRVRGT
jgi:hypothetical protein